MLDKLVDFVISILGWFKCAQVVHAYERGVLLRLGAPVNPWVSLPFRPRKGSAILEPGKLYLHLPLKLEETIHTHVVADPTVMPEQSVTTADGHAVTLTPVVTHEVEDVCQLLLGVSTLAAALSDATSGAVTTLALRHTWAELIADDFANEVAKKVRARARRHGIKVTDVQFRDLVKCRTIRLLHSDGAAWQHAQGGGHEG